MRPYHYWKFRAGLDALAQGDDPLRVRLLHALLSFVGVLERDLPEPVRSTYLELQAQVTWKQDGDPNEGTWKNTLDAMSDQDARTVAELIVKLLEQSIDPTEPEDA